MNSGVTAAYMLTAAIAERDATAADAAVGGLAQGELWPVVIALGAQARHAAWAAGDGARERQLAQVAEWLPASPARAAAITALGPGPLDPAVAVPAAELLTAARCLARVTVATLAAAGWHGRSAAGLCRRAAR